LDHEKWGKKGGTECNLKIVIQLKRFSIKKIQDSSSLQKYAAKLSITFRLHQNLLLKIPK